MAPTTRPATICFWTEVKATITGMVAKTQAAIISPHGPGSGKYTVIGRGQWFWFWYWSGWWQKDFVPAHDKGIDTYCRQAWFGQRNNNLI